MEALARKQVGEKTGRRKPVSHNLNGQRLGRKGRDTRARILSAARDLLANPAEPMISLSAVAREASMGMTSLYLYFSDLSELILSVLEPVIADAESSFLEQLRKPWPDETLFAQCHAFMLSFHSYWERNARILHLRDTMAAQGDKPMMMQRVAMSEEMIGLLLTQMGHEDADYHGPAMGMATALYAGFERLVIIATDAKIPTQIDRPFEPRTDHLLRAEARLLELGIREFRSNAS